MKAIWTELREQLDWLFGFGLCAAPLDGIVIAQAWDWMTHAGRMSIWVLL